jgi:glycerol kinase
MQFIADIVGTDIVVPLTADFSPLGAALAGLLGMSVYASTEPIKNLVIDEQVFRPQMPRSVAAALYLGWSSAVRQVFNAPLQTS